MTQLQTVKKAAAFISKKTKNFKPEIALITGSGLANSVPELKNKKVIPYAEIPGFLRSTVAGHSGNLIFGEYKGKKIAVMGCAVNGPGEARDADFGIAGGKGEGLWFEKGQIIEKLPQKIWIKRLLEEIKK